MLATNVVKGLDIPLAGKPAQVVSDARPAARLGVMLRDHVGLKARLLVEPGDRVAIGQPVLEHRIHSAIRFVSPVSGYVETVHRGDKRSLQSVVIAADPTDTPASPFATFSSRAADSPEGVRALLMESGLWPAFRTRPFSQVPEPDSVPHAVFVTALDTQPLAPDLDVVLRDRTEAFSRGLRVLTQLTTGTVYLCRKSGSTLGDGGSIDRVHIAEFSGKHPAGTVGFHIHTLDPVHREKSVWHVGAQDVARIGHLFATGTLDMSHVIAVGGPRVSSPRLLRTTVGAAVSGLMQGEVNDGSSARVISGSILTGDRTDDAAHDFLGRFHQQISVIDDGADREFLGWMAPGSTSYSLWPAFLSALLPKRDRVLSTAVHGSRRAMVPIGAYERVMPMDLMPTHLLRALTLGDVEWAEELGALELDEEDVALCTFVCPGKYEYGAALRRTLKSLAAEH